MAGILIGADLATCVTDFFHVLHTVCTGSCRLIPVAMLTRNVDFEKSQTASHVSFSASKNSVKLFHRLFGVIITPVGLAGRKALVASVAIFR